MVWKRLQQELHIGPSIVDDDELPVGRVRAWGIV